MAATSRLLAFYRIVVVLLVAGVAVGLTVRRWGRRWPRPPVVVRDLGAELATLAAEAPRIVDRSETYYHSSRASVHVHVMGYGQRCPLHLHAETHEATVVVSGEAQVVQLSGAGTGLARTAATYPEGWLIASPPRCATPPSKKS